MISIIIPIYNQADKLPKCLDSVLNQSYRDYEVLVVNDGSTDNLQLVLEDYGQRFDSWQVINQANQGAPIARNNGVKKSKGEFLLFCDADVVFKPEALRIMRDTLAAQPNVSFAYSAFYYGKKLFPLVPYDATRLKQEPFIHTTALIRKEHFPGFDEKLKRFQDWDLWLTMLKQGYRGSGIDSPLFTVLPHGRISNWLPKIVYRLLPWLPAVKAYQAAMKIIKNKHGIV